MRNIMRRLSMKNLGQVFLLSVLGIFVLAVAGGAIANRVSPFPLQRLENQPASPMVTDRNGNILLSHVGVDDHWRYPVPLTSMSPWLMKATVAVEDERFWSHAGVDLISVGRAGLQDLYARRIVSGASTLTMQINRMLDNRPRTFVSKTIEAFRALQLEHARDKNEILEIYLNMAPYGGNIRGVEAASRHYFDKTANDLSLAEAALLSGIPQSPSRLRPDRYPEKALRRRSTVLRRMSELRMITNEQRTKADAEPLHLARTCGRYAGRHAAHMALQRNPAGGKTTIDFEIQTKLEELVSSHKQQFDSRIQIAAVAIEIESAEIVALIGSADFDGPIDGQVNGALAPRSPGSALKPFVYAAAFEDRMINPQTIIYDMPVRLAGWRPRNFDRTFAGEVTATESLQRSLNMPAILLAQAVGLSRCAGILESAGIPLSEHAVARAGLSLVVGAVEVNLLDLTNGYATIGRRGIRMTPRLFLDDQADRAPALDANACAALDDILSSHNRRPRGMEDLAEVDVPWFMWKTGTSSQRRDAWAVGHNGKYAIGVWVGCFSGAGNPGLVGARAAEPLLARIFSVSTLRTDKKTPGYTNWTVTNPLPSPDGLQEPLRITSPYSGAIFLEINGRAIIEPEVNRNEEVTWFLDGMHVNSDGSHRLAVSAGTHKLCCTDSIGQTASTVFHVKEK